MTRDTTHPINPAGALLRSAAYRLVAEYLENVPGDSESDVRVWRAVDLALDAAALPPMTAPALRGLATAAEAGLMIQTAAGLEPVPRSARPARPDELHGGTIGRHNDGEAPHWRALVLEHGLDDARDVVCSRIAAGGPITGLPASWDEHVAWMFKYGLADHIDARAGLNFVVGEQALLADQGVPSYAVAAILGRQREAIDKKRQRLRNELPRQEA